MAVTGKRMPVAAFFVLCLSSKLHLSTKLCFESVKEIKLMWITKGKKGGLQGARYPFPELPPPPDTS